MSLITAIARRAKTLGMLRIQGATLVRTGLFSTAAILTPPHNLLMKACVLGLPAESILCQNDTVR